MRTRLWIQCSRAVSGLTSWWPRFCSMDLYRSLFRQNKRATATGSMALYGDAVSGISAYTAAHSHGILSSTTAPEPMREQGEAGPRQLAHEQTAGDDAVKDNPWLLASTTSDELTASGQKHGGQSERGSIPQHNPELALLDAHFTGELRAASAVHQSSLAPLPAGPEGNEYTAVGSVGTAGGGGGVIQVQEVNVRGHAIVDGREVEMTDFADAGRLMVATSPTAVRSERFVDKEETEEPFRKPPPPPPAKTSTRSLVILVCGVCQAQFGMIMFNLGLNFGFTSLGDQVGRPLPPAPPSRHSPHLPLSTLHRPWHDSRLKEILSEESPFFFK